MTMTRKRFGAVSLAALLLAAAPAVTLGSDTYYNNFNLYGQIDIDQDGTLELDEHHPFAFSRQGSGVGEGRQLHTLPSPHYFGETIAQGASIYQAAADRAGLQAKSHSKVRIDETFSNQIGLQWSSDSEARLNVQDIFISADPGYDAFIPIVMRFNFTLDLTASHTRHGGANVFDGIAHETWVDVTFDDDSIAGHARDFSFGGQPLNFEKDGVLSGLSSMNGVATFSIQETFIPAFAETADLDIRIKAASFANGVFGPLPGVGEVSSDLLADLTFTVDTFIGLRSGLIEAPEGYHVHSLDGVITDGEIHPDAFVPPIPEPGTLIMLATGGLLAFRRRRS